MLPFQGAQVGFLVRELRSHMPRSMAKTFFKVLLIKKKTSILPSPHRLFTVLYLVRSLLAEIGRIQSLALKMTI